MSHDRGGGLATKAETHRAARWQGAGVVILCSEVFPLSYEIFGGA